MIVNVIYSQITLEVKCKMRIHFEIRKIGVYDTLQREHVEIFEVANKNDLNREIEKLRSINPEELQTIIITNINGEKVE